MENAELKAEINILKSENQTLIERLTEQENKKELILTSYKLLPKSGASPKIYIFLNGSELLRYNLYKSVQNSTGVTFVYLESQLVLFSVAAS